MQINPYKCYPLPVGSCREYIQHIDNLLAANVIGIVTNSFGEVWCYICPWFLLRSLRVEIAVEVDNFLYQYDPNFWPST